MGYSIEKFLITYESAKPNPELHDVAIAKTQRSTVKKQAYSDAESQSFPKGFNPWTVLGLPKQRSIPSSEDLKAAYKNAAKKWHPDKCQGKKSECEAKMAQTALANNVLSDGRRLQQWEAW